jgi:hypothetical protein
VKERCGNHDKQLFTTGAGKNELPKESMPLSRQRELLGPILRQLLATPRRGMHCQMIAKAHSVMGPSGHFSHFTEKDCPSIS